MLNHIGINLYSNVASVVAETVANSWDADAKEIDDRVDVGNDLIEISDDGDGMSRDINN